MTLYFIYQITNHLNDKVYYGWTKDLRRRWTEHLTARHKINHHLYHAMNKYGIGAFSLSVIGISFTPEDAAKLEKLIIQKMVDKFPDQVYNKIQGKRISNRGPDGRIIKSTSSNFKKYEEAQNGNR